MTKYYFTTTSVNKRLPCARGAFLLSFCKCGRLEIEAVKRVEYARAIRSGCCGRRCGVAVVATTVEPAIEQQNYKGDDEPVCQRQLVVLVQHGVQQQQIQ